jgi:putative transposase
LYNPEIHHRKSLRLKSHDYNQSGLYFVTICTEMRMHLFGEILGTGSESVKMYSNEFGQIVIETWLDLKKHNANITLHDFVLMPNHVHGIIQIHTANACRLTEIVRQFKAFSSRKINSHRLSPGEKIWQRGFHDHIIRNHTAYLRIAAYIKSNPLRWDDDEYF